LINSYFENNIAPQRIIEFLETTVNDRIIPTETLLILDEIQSCERALLSLKTFCEEAPQYHIAAAGSLLGVAINRERYSFPVGKVNELSLFPLDFEEYLWALNKKMLADEIRKHFIQNESMPVALHEEAMEIYRKYLVTGGMPAVVDEYVDSGSLVNLAVIQSQIVNEYIADMSKYASSTSSVKIRSCYNSMPAQLAKENKKFQYKTVQHGGTATIFGEAIEWLNFAGIVLKCQKINHGVIPLAVYSDLADFKLYMSDTGILTMKSGMPAQLILTATNEDNTFMGALAENYVAQALSANKYPLYYWKNDNTAEVDFVLQQEDKVIPIEVKKGLHVRSKSLGIFDSRYDCPYKIRISQKNFGFENNIKSVPMYAVFCI
jgi:predicted AAA+ superfamily ATPase